MNLFNVVSLICFFSFNIPFGRGDSISKFTLGGSGGLYTCMRSVSTNSFCNCAKITEEETSFTRGSCEEHDLCASHDGKCVEQCPLDHQYRTSAGLCQASCPRDQQYCVAKSKWHSCVPECPKNYYTSGSGECLPCAKECNGCHGPSSSNCIECSYASYRKTCVLGCSNSTVRIGGFCWPVDMCSHVVYKGDCQSDCPLDYFPKDTNSSNKRCDSCNKECLGGCRGDGNDKCNGCRHFKYNSTCVKECPINAKLSYYSNCFSECPVLLSDGTCVSQCSGDKKAYNKTCVDSCPDAAPIIRNRKCVTLCDKVLHNHKCLDQCPHNLYLYENNCTDLCPDIAPFINGTHCVRQCIHFQFHANNATHCVKSCPRNYKVYNKSCIHTCPIDHPLPDPITQECKSNCSYYTIPNVESCLKECPGVLWGFNHTCLPKCPSNTVIFNKECLDLCPLSSTNKYDNGGTCATNCSGKTPVSLNFTCVHSCPENLLTDTNMECVVRCSQYHASYVYNSTCMHKCPVEAPFHWNKRCVKTCPIELFLDWNSECVTQCSAHVSYMYQRQCVQHCPTEAPLSANKTCVASCPSGLYLQNRNCLTDCPGSAPYRNGQSCTNCCPDLSVDKNCINSCNSNLFELKVEKPGCRTAVCTDECPQTHAVHNSSCVPLNCVGNTPFIIDRRCISKCPTSHLFSRDNFCVSKCPEGWLHDGQTPTKCVQNCEDEDIYPCFKTCNESGKVWNGESCNNQCRKTQYRFKHLCLDNWCSNYRSGDYYITSVIGDELLQTSTRDCDTVCPSSKSLLQDPDGTRVCVSSCSDSFYNLQFNQTCVTRCPDSWGIDLRGKCVAECPNDAKWISVVHDDSVNVEFKCAPYYTLYTSLVLAVSSVVVLIMACYVIEIIRGRRRRLTALEEAERRLQHVTFCWKSQPAHHQRTENHISIPKDEDIIPETQDTHRTFDNQMSAVLPDQSSETGLTERDLFLETLGSSDQRQVTAEVHGAPSETYGNTDSKAKKHEEDNSYVSSHDRERREEVHQRNTKMKSFLLEDDKSEESLSELPGTDKEAVQDTGV